MSQFYQGVTAGSLPPSVPTSFVTDSGTATPAANILNVVTPGGGTQGISTLGSGNTLTITLTTPFATGTVTTVGAVTGNLITLALGSTPGTYTFDCQIAGFNSSTPAGAGYTIVGSVRTNGTTATLLTGQAVDSFEEVATATCSAALTVSGNNAIFQVTGAAGLTIDWKGALEYIFVG